MTNEFSLKQAIGLLSILAAAFFFFVIVFPTGAELNVQFPVKELGNCGSQEECHSYCEVPGNMNACLAFAERNNLMSEQELSEARAFLNAGGKGPGGCTSKDSCEAFCNDTSNIKECIAFAERSGMMSGEELEEAKKVMKALEAGATLPGGCTSKESCDAYCGSSDPSHMKECISFARAAGFMSEEELMEVDKIMGALEKGVTPPKCRGDEECAVYCADHVDECIAFGLASGMMDEKQAEMLRKTGGKGPGGCLGKACETFCDDPAHEEACFNFAVESGQIEPQEFQKMKEGRDRFKNDFGTMPESVQECLKNSIGDEFDAMLRGNPPSEGSRAKMEACFSQMRPPSGSEFGAPPSGSGGGYGPRPDESGSFEGRPPEGFMPPEGFPHPPEGSVMPTPPEAYQRPPEGYQMPPEGYRVPPEGFTPYQGEGSGYSVPVDQGTVPSGEYSPPPATETIQPPASESPASGGTAPSEGSIEPSSFSPQKEMASLLSVFLGVFK